jgi:hypothetical protein
MRIYLVQFQSILVYKVFFDMRSVACSSSYSPVPSSNSCAIAGSLCRKSECFYPRAPLHEIDLELLPASRTMSVFSHLLMASGSSLFSPTVALALCLDLSRLLYHFATATTRNIVTITG